MLTLVSLPTPSDLLASVGAWSSALFTDLLPISALMAGLVVGGLLLGGLIRWIVGGVSRITNNKDY